MRRIAKILRATENKSALTLIEVLMVLAGVMLLIAALLPSFTRPHYHSSRLGCVNNLKQVGIAFRVWAGDNNDKYPMLVSVTNGGTMELVSGPNAFRHFEVMSNELNTPKILLCPNESDRSRTRATTFEKTASISGQILFAGNSNLSYFVGVEATDAKPNMLLTGDRNLTNGMAVINGMLELTPPHPSRWTKDIHVNQGNIGLADGSVQTFSTSQLQNFLLHSGIATNRLTMP